MDSKMILSQDELKGATQALDTAAQELLDSQNIRPNVVGVAAGMKWTNGQPTGEPSVIVLVTQKIYSGLSESAMIPAHVGDMPTDVLAIGHPFAGADVLLQRAVSGRTPSDSVGNFLNGVNTAPSLELSPPQVVAPETVAARVRPAQGGWSVGHYNITAGTIATCVYDMLPGASSNPPTYGVGMPSKYYILSNNHVLANSNAGNPGDPILQPGPYDGGADPTDRIATLSRFVPIMFEPPLPRFLHRNVVDAAIAEARIEDIDRSIYWNGVVRGWKTKAQVNVGMPIKKTGRTTNLTVGRVVAINATVDVGYGGGKVARFTDQIITTPMSAGGDSGSLILSAEDNQAVGLLFAGSSQVTIANQFENVRTYLRIEVWP